jgi:hypothetical protein
MDLKNATEEELKSELQRREDAKKMPQLNPNPDFTKLISSCAAVAKDLEEQRYSKDAYHFIYAEAMTAVFGEGFWNWMRENDKGS